ncbi:MAG: methyltransferase domain-containing protein [Deltaproteobacteria bacterium]|nr:methyltransferase domain-containing protein [Deltaproteobacteria bacterium]
MTNEETVDEILGGRLKIRQSKRGYRFNLDSLILAHFVSLKSRSVGLDLGCGNGIIALVLAGRFAQSRWHGLEVQQGLAELAKTNVSQNGLGRRVIIDTGDARDIKKIYTAGFFDAVVFNPPYRKMDSGRINPLPEKAIARHEISGSVGHFLWAAKYALKPGGRVFTIFPATRLVELISFFRRNAIEPKRMKPVYSDTVSDAEFVLVEGRSGAREELKLEPPLYIYAEGRKYTRAMEQIFTDLASPPAASGG